MTATIDWARKQKTGDGYRQLVLVTLSFYANWETGETWVSADKLADECQTCERTIRRRLSELQDLGFIQIVARPGRSSIIRLTGYKEWHQTLPKRVVTPDYQSDVSNDHTGLLVRTPRTNSPRTPDYQSDELIKRTILNNSFSKAELDSNTTQASDDRVWISDDKIHLSDKLNQYWLKQFNGQQDDLNLALVQISAYVQPNNKIHSLEKQISSQLARIVRDRNEKNRRYQDAVKNKSQNGKVNPQESKIQEIQDKIYHDHMAMLERGGLKL